MDIKQSAIREIQNDFDTHIRNIIAREGRQMNASQRSLMAAQIRAISRAFMSKSFDAGTRIGWASEQENEI